MINFFYEFKIVLKTFIITQKFDIEDVQAYDEKNYQINILLIINLYIITSNSITINRLKIDFETYFLTKIYDSI